MHDFSFFLLQNWLPVGVSAILFFGIGMLLAKFIWGRFHQRLANAIEENMNLASQWSALGASQQDLFKKLRVRWQADRDAFESVISEKDLQIARLGGQLKASGGAVPSDLTISAEEIATAARVRELESALAEEKAVVARLREEQASEKEPKVLPFAVVDRGAASKDKKEDLQARLRDLEQDLIDTHDELHRVRADYDKQVKLVESLEERLIAMPAVSETASGPSREQIQIAALLAQRSREFRRERERLFGQGKVREAELRQELGGLETRLAASEALAGEKDGEVARLSSEVSEGAAALAEIQAQLDAAGALAGERFEEIERLGKELSGKETVIEALREQAGEVELLRRRRASLQAELNDACHELYDVRRALHSRIETVETLEARVSEFDVVQATNADLSRNLDSTREQLAAALQAQAGAETARDEGQLELEALRSELKAKRDEAEETAAQLNEVRRELSEVRIALNVKSGDYDKAKAQMEELEAIIGDRSAEVNDLSTELRQQRDLVRQLKESLAGTQGELEALSDESRRLNAGVKARIAFAEEQQMRIAALEGALAERYHELNRARVDAEEHSRNARHHESRASQLEAELQRRGAEFEASDRRIATAEEALEAANLQIASLSERLQAAESSIGELQHEVQTLSREKDDTLRDLERASRRIGELEEAARRREIQVVEIEREMQEAKALSGPLEQRLERLQVELENARQEREASAAAVAELEEALRASDEKTLQLSGRLDEKEGEVAALQVELVRLGTEVDSRAAAETEAQVRLAALESQLETRIAEIRSENEMFGEAQAREITLQSGEIVELRQKLVEERAKAEEEASLREASQAEIAALREKLAARTESIRDLQNQISSVMMQRDSRDTELSLLKDKLKSMEEKLRQPVPEVVAESKPAAAKVAVIDPVALASVEEELRAEAEEATGISLDTLPASKVHHPPKTTPVTAAAPEEPAPVWMNEEDDLTVFFNESAAVPSQAELEKIDRSARSIRRLGRKVEVTVIGYAGAEGSSDFNESVSARRADSVRERLVERGVSQSVVKVRAAGQDRRFSDWKARRVEVIVAPIAVAETVN